jgi:hypothetical protein
MTSRTYSPYTDRQALELCACITLDELLARGTNAQNPIFKNLAGFIHNAKAHDCGAHLLEWLDGSLVLVISATAREYSELSRHAVAAAYRYAASGQGLIFRNCEGVNYEPATL